MHQPGRTQSSELTHPRNGSGLVAWCHVSAGAGAAPAGDATRASAAVAARVNRAANLRGISHPPSGGRALARSDSATTLTHRPVRGKGCRPRRPREPGGAPDVLGQRCLTGKARLRRTARGKANIMALVLILALLAVVFIGLGFVVKWLFILAIIAALLAAISYFSGNRRTI
jgi:hypothetical protein